MIVVGDDLCRIIVIMNRFACAIGLIIALASATPAQKMRLRTGGAVEFVAVADVQSHTAWNSAGTRVGWPTKPGQLETIDSKFGVFDSNFRGSAYVRRYVLFRCTSKGAEPIGMSVSSPDQPANGHGFVSIGNVGDLAGFVALVPKGLVTATVIANAIHGPWSEIVSFDIANGKIANAKTNGRWVKLLRVPAGYTISADQGVHPASPGYGEDKAPERTAIQYAEDFQSPNKCIRWELFDLRGQLVSGPGATGGLYPKFEQGIYLGKPESFSRFRARSQATQNLTFKQVRMNLR
jgi:hypothetical protein